MYSGGKGQGGWWGKKQYKGQTKNQHGKKMTRRKTTKVNHSKCISTESRVRQAAWDSTTAKQDMESVQNKAIYIATGTRGLGTEDCEETASASEHLREDDCEDCGKDQEPEDGDHQRT